MVSYLISPASYSKATNQNTMPCLRKLSSTKITMKTMKHAMFLSNNNKKNLTQPLRKWHRSNLTSACKSFICRQEGETEHFTKKNRSPPFGNLFGQPLINTWEVHHWISLFPLSVRYLFNLCGIIILKQLFTSVSVNSGGYLPPLWWIIVNYCKDQGEIKL